MKRTNILSCVLVILFMVSCMCFFSVNAEPDSDNTTATASAAVEQTTTEATTSPTTTIQATEPTTQTTINTTVATTKKTKKVTSADPTYTKKTTTTKTNTTAGGYVTQYQNDVTGGTKETKEIMTTETTTEPTTAAKNIVNYGSKYRPLKWLSLAVMIACVIALVAINVRYKKKYGKFNQNKNGKGKKTSKKNEAPKLDTSAKFDNAKAKPSQQYQKSPKSADENFDKTAVVDISSFSNKNNNAFKPKPDLKGVDSDIVSNKKEKDDDDLYI